MADIASTTTPWPPDIMENYRWLDEHLQKQPATIKEFQPAWQAYKYLLHGKMYAYIGVNDKNGRPIITMKLDPDYSDIMRQEYADIVPGYYRKIGVSVLLPVCFRIHWITEKRRQVFLMMLRNAISALSTIPISMLCAMTLGWSGWGIAKSLSKTT